MSKVLPVFYDHSSNKSILTYWKSKDYTPKGPKSIVALCKESGLKSCFGASTNFLTFPEAQTNLSKEGIEFFFGLELWICDNPEDLSPASLTSESKIIIRADNSQGYFDLKRIYSKINTNRKNFYYKHRSSFKEIGDLWTNNLTLILPFCDSFVFQNTLTTASILPTLPVNPLIFREVDSGLPFANLVNKALDEYNADKRCQEQNVKTIFYPTKDHFKAWQNYRCIKLRSAFQKPQMDFCCSDKFNFEDWKKIL